jgi:hypothetical protein
MLASVLSRNHLNNDDKRQLHEVIEELDAAVRAIRDTVFAHGEPDLNIPPAA